MIKMTVKQLREKAEELAANGVTNKAALFAAVPVLTELQETARAVRATASACSEVAKTLATMCSEYAREHQSVFNDGLVEERDNVFCGDLTIDDMTYHFVSSPGEVARQNGDNMTQGFLKKLPENMTSTNLKLNVGKLDDAELAKVGLVRELKGTWSVKE